MYLFQKSMTQDRFYGSIPIKPMSETENSWVIGFQRWKKTEILIISIPPEHFWYNIPEKNGHTVCFNTFRGRETDSSWRIGKGDRLITWNYTRTLAYWNFGFIMYKRRELFCKAVGEEE